MCGEVKRPTGAPSLDNPLAVLSATDPLPFVPAIWTYLKSFISRDNLCSKTFNKISLYSFDFGAFLGVNLSNVFCEFKIDSIASS